MAVLSGEAPWEPSQHFANLRVVAGLGYDRTPDPEALAEEMRGERERPRPKVAFEVAERVKIIDGAFANFMGNIGEINEERAKMKVLIEIFERQTSVEVEFWQVEKI